MADSKRVFVQLAGTHDSQIKIKAPVMAFVMPTDSWLSVVNEFLMVLKTPLFIQRLPVSFS